MKNNLPVVAIITESLRRDNQKPLQYFNKVKILHFYQNAPYGNETKEDLKDAIRFTDDKDLYQKIIQAQPDIIQGAEPYGSRKMFMLCIVAYRIAKKLNIPLIFPWWENRPAKERFSFAQRIIVNAFAKRYLNLATKVIYINKGALRNIHALGIKDDNKLIPFLWGTWGVDVDEFCPIKESKDITKSPMILYVGRLVPEKGIKYLLKSFVKVHKRFPTAQLVIIGTGELTEYIKEFRDKNDLKNQIILKGSIDNKDLPAYYQRATVFVSPAITTKKWEEQVGMTNVQAMACGIPVVSTNSGAIPEYVPNKIAGLLVPEKDSDRLASAIISILDDERLHDRIAKDARQYAVTHYDAKKNILLAQDIILNILSHEKKLQ